MLKSKVKYGAPKANAVTAAFQLLSTIMPEPCSYETRRQWALILLLRDDPSALRSRNRLILVKEGRRRTLNRRTATHGLTKERTLCTEARCNADKPFTYAYGSVSDKAVTLQYPGAKHHVLNLSTSYVYILILSYVSICSMCHV